ncbi:VOC family protein [Halalkalirubrum salinum]|uniref:VOC family protein n=1 Tax=Halalkalirubrum salinum TaxID=2563889 RepID=UPI0010BF9DF1|nr:VOC family protein [Halalkalirubrum salinum]
MTEPSAHHIGITVADLERAINFYSKTLGLDILTRFSVSGEAFATAVDVDGATGSFAHVDAGGARIELVEYEPCGKARTPGTINRPGGTHVGLAVDDIDGFYEEIKDEVGPISEPQTTESGTRIFFVRDPDGTLVEFIES